MKYLLLNRHASSLSAGFKMSDHDRELAQIGFKECELMGKKIRQKEISFDLMLSSSAIRAYVTCQLMASEMNYPIDKIQVCSNIYGANKDLLKSIIKNTSDHVDSLAVYGHNPAFHLLAEELYNENICQFPPCSMLYVSFDVVNWINCFEGNRKFIFFHFPTI